MTEPTDRRDQPTDASPPPDAATNPEASMAPIPPAARVPRLSEPMQGELINYLIRLYEEQRDRDRDTLDADGLLAKRADDRAERVKRETVVELGAIVDRVAGEPVRDLAKRLGKLAEGLAKIGETTDRNAREIERLEKSYSALKNELSTLRDDLFQSMTRVDQLEARLDKQHSSEPT